MLLTKKIRIKPDRKLAEYLEEASERCRLLYNFALAEKKEHYEKTGKHLGGYAHLNTLSAVKAQFPEYQRVYSQCLQEVHARLDKAYKAVLEGKTFEERDERGTTRECCKCGAIREMSLADRTYECPQCGLAIDRDTNSAFNMKNRYEKQKRGATAGPSLTTRKELVRASKLTTTANLFAYD